MDDSLAQPKTSELILNSSCTEKGKKTFFQYCECIKLDQTFTENYQELMPYEDLVLKLRLGDP